MFYTSGNMTDKEFINSEETSIYFSFPLYCLKYTNMMRHLLVKINYQTFICNMSRSIICQNINTCVCAWEREKSAQWGIQETFSKFDSSSLLPMCHPNLSWEKWHQAAQVSSISSNHWFAAVKGFVLTLSKHPPALECVSPEPNKSLCMWFMLIDCRLGASPLRFLYVDHINCQ